MILDPMAGHAPVARNVMLPSVRGTLLKLAVLDGAFLVSSAGIVISAARCLDVTTKGVDIPLGLGSRHLAAASITRLTKAIAVVVSEGSPVVRLFHHGRLVDQIDVTQIDVTQTDASPTGTNTHRSLSSVAPAAHGSSSESLLRSALPKPSPTRKAGDSELTTQLPPAIRSTAHLPAVRT
ncbi:MAG: hypothetical protein ACJAYX_004303 [Planctomycetota bacterium]